MIYIQFLLYFLFLFLTVWPELREALHNHIKKLNVAKDVVKKKVPKETVVQKVTVESEIKRRRYTAFMSDLENAILYSLSHEVASRYYSYITSTIL